MDLGFSFLNDEESFVQSFIADFSYDNGMSDHSGVDSMFSPAQERSGMFSFDYSSFLGTEAMEEDIPQFLPQKSYEERRPSPFIKQESTKTSRDCFAYTAPSFAKTTSRTNESLKPVSKKRTLDPTDIQQECAKMPQFNILDDQSTFLHQPCIVKEEKVIPSYETPQIASVELVVERQPPVEVRTRTPSENRNFGVTVRVAGDYERLDIERVEVRLCYAVSGEADVKQSILGGKKVVTVQEDGRAVFDNLSMCEASTKHGEREFCLEFVPLNGAGKAIPNLGIRSNAFYAYSHMKVLTRRKSVKLRTLSKNAGRVSGGEEMHVVGQPFIRGPSLKVVFRTPHGDVPAPKLEIYSDSVLFFESPPYPNAGVLSAYSGKNVEIKATVQVTNDGRTLSNPLDFTYVSGNSDRHY